MKRNKILDRVIRFLEWRGFDLRNGALFVALAFFLIGAISVHNIVSRNVARAHVDEWNTLFLGTQFLSPWTGAPYGVYVGEMNRWFVRLLYPLGVYYMNTRMGGDWESVVLGLPGPPGAPNPATHRQWNYPGGYYLAEKFNGKSWDFFDSKEFTLDPNVQDYVFAMRLAFGIMAVLSFSLVIWALGRKVNPIASAVYGGLVLSKSVVFSQFQIFYTETSLFLIFNLSMFLYLYADRVTHRVSISLGILSAAALSTKLTGLLIAIPVFFHVLAGCTNGDRGRVRKFESYAAALVMAVIVLNFWTKSVFDFVNETLVNVYNYTGARNVEDVPLRYFESVAAHLIYLFIGVCISFVVWLVAQWRRDLVLVYALAATVAIFAWSMSNASTWADRNISLPYVAMSFIVALGAGNFVELAARRAGESRAPLFRACSAVAVTAFLVAALAVSGPRLLSMERIFSDKVKGETARCGDIGAVGISHEDAVRLTGRNDVTAFERLDWPMRSTREGEKINRWYEKYLDFDCLVVKPDGESKHISNYFAPLTHDMSVRVGSLFFFTPRGMNAEEREEAYRAAWPSIVANPPAARSVFDVHVRRSELIYIKKNCVPGDIEELFFVIVEPADERNVPESARRTDFHFPSHGAQFDGKCMAAVPLPAYDIARVKTGQTDGFNMMWDVEIPFDDHTVSTGSTR